MSSGRLIGFLELSLGTEAGRRCNYPHAEPPESRASPSYSQRPAHPGRPSAGGPLRGETVEVGKEEQPSFEIAGQHFEYHWYEHPGIGKVEVKRKQVRQR